MPVELPGRQRANMRLAMVEAGRRVRVVGIEAGRALQARLASMGLFPGMELEVVRNVGQGPFVVAIKHSRMILGRGMAHKIVVE